jgi:hypothetical protein
MKNHLKLFGLALCMLPMYLHAGTGADLKPTYQPAQLIPAGTILPVSLNSALRSDRTGSGTTITATVMQDVPLGMGKTLRRGSKVTGHIIEAINSGRGSDESSISFQFDDVRFDNLTVPITASLRAVASTTAVFAAASQPTSIEYADNQVQIGSDQISYGSDGPVMVGSQVVGRYTSQGVLAYADQDSGGPYHGTADSNALPQAFWLFSVNARGTYGFGDLTILLSGPTAPVGEVTLNSNRKSVKVGKGSAMLLRVEGSGSQGIQPDSTPSPEAAIRTAQ